MKESYRRIYAAVRKIPKGYVATYGQVARMAGLPGHARQVGTALSELKDNTIPWQRVINAQGEISGRAEPHFEQRQRTRLEKEGIVFSASGRISLPRYQWKAYFD